MDYLKRVEFAQWFLQKGVGDLSVPASVISAEETPSCREDLFSVHNPHMGAYDNLYGTRSITHCSIVLPQICGLEHGDCLLGP
ncbi:hypothetical protein TNCV_3652371 [Trichonephila clavipes]|nr:hypothetical protein TNCV_3652371 [Trichonephila clavipes]